jgi:hypothetical protein
VRRRRWGRRRMEWLVYVFGWGGPRFRIRIRGSIMRAVYEQGVHKAISCCLAVLLPAVLALDSGTRLGAWRVVLTPAMIEVP